MSGNLPDAGWQVSAILLLLQHRAQLLLLRGHQGKRSFGAQQEEEDPINLKTGCQEEKRFSAEEDQYSNCRASFPSSGSSSLSPSPPPSFATPCFWEASSHVMCGEVGRAHFLQLGRRSPFFSTTSPPPAQNSGVYTSYPATFLPSTTLQTYRTLSFSSATSHPSYSRRRL